jgi:hypothetical protein
MLTELREYSGGDLGRFTIDRFLPSQPAENDPWLRVNNDGKGGGTHG